MGERAENIVAITVVVLVSIAVIMFWPRPAPAAPQTDFIMNDPHLGEEGQAIIVYCDYTIEACRTFINETVPQLEPLITAGKAYLVMRDYPLSEQGLLAAEASECADEQGLFWAYLPHLVASPNVTLSGAKAAGLDTNDFRRCLEARRYETEVEDDVSRARTLYVTTAPTIIIGNERTTSPSFTSIERLLAQA